MPDLDYVDLFRSLPYAVQIIDSDLVARDATNEYLRVTMRTREQLVGKPVFEVFPPPSEDDKSYRDLLSSFRVVLEARRTHRLPPIEYPVRSADGMEIRHWQVVNAPLVGADGDAYVINAIVDLTEVVRREEMRQELVETLARTLGGISSTADDLRRALETSAADTADFPVSHALSDPASAHGAQQGPDVTTGT